MSPGTWAQFTGAIGQDLAVAHASNAGEYNNTNAASGSATHYGNKCAWNPRTKKIQIVGSDHYYDLNGIQRLAEYSDATNAWTRAQNDTGLTAILAGVRHAGDGAVANPVTGDLYHLVFKADSEAPASNMLVRIWSGGTWTNKQVPVLLFADRPIGACWWPAAGAFSGAGAQGCYVIYNSGDTAGGGASTDGGIYAYDPLTDNWFLRVQSMMPNYGQTGGGTTYNTVIDYSAVFNCAIYGGGAGGKTGSQGRQMRRLNANGTSTAMPDFPGAGTVGIDSGNLCCDPVTGKFLVVSSGELWDLDPSGAGTWAQLTGASSPPGGFGGVLDPAGDHAGSTNGILSCPIPDYGVVVYVIQAGAAGGSMYLYKRA